mmetsp:Transcript_32545/g.100724  ORF Transcript_32545/g.100724 Transcript_32545/m.100724 type:complete len:159 (+) Transcript_32545:355-831(+)
MRLPRGLLCSYQAHKVSLSRRPFLRLYAASPDAMSARPPEAVADAEVLAELTSPVVLDVRDPAEVAAGKGGPPDRIPGSINVPLNIDGAKQSERPTTPDEFFKAIAAKGVVLPYDAQIITHCGSGGRGGKAAKILRDAGYDAYNGGGPANIAAAREDA